MMTKCSRRRGSQNSSSFHCNVENSAVILRNSLWSAVQIADILISHHGNDQLSHSDFTAVTGVNQLEPVLIRNGRTATATKKKRLLGYWCGSLGPLWLLPKANWKITIFFLDQRTQPFSSSQSVSPYQITRG